jgi:hypothetical protein
MDLLIKERIVMLNGRNDTDAIARQKAREIIGSSIDYNRHVLELIWLYLYQVGDIGSLINKGLRRLYLTTFLHHMYLQFIDMFKKLLPVGKEIIIFRGVPSRELKGYHVGDIISDRAFNSTSLDPRVAEFFNDHILVITLRPTDTLLYINGSEYLFPDTFECILPPGTQYRINAIQPSVIDHRPVTLYSVETIGTISIPLITIDPTFDSMFNDLISTLSQAIRSNLERPIEEWISILYSTNNDTWMESQLPPGVPEIDAPFFNNFIDTVDSITRTIIDHTDLYIKLFNKEITAIYLLPRPIALQIQVTDNKTLLMNYTPIIELT